MPVCYCFCNWVGFAIEISFLNRDVVAIYRNNDAYMIMPNRRKDCSSSRNIGQFKLIRMGCNQLCGTVPAISPETRIIAIDLIESSPGKPGTLPGKAQSGIGVIVSPGFFISEIRLY